MRQTCVIDSGLNGDQYPDGRNGLDLAHGVQSTRLLHCRRADEGARRRMAALASVRRVVARATRRCARLLWPAEQVQCSYCSGPQRAEGDGTPRTRPRLSRQFDEQYNQRDAENDLAVHPHLALSALDECHPRVVVTSIPETLRCYRRPPQATVGGKRLDGARLVHVLTLVGLFVKEAMMPLGNHAKASVRRAC